MQGDGREHPSSPASPYTPSRGAYAPQTTPPNSANDPHDTLDMYGTADERAGYGEYDEYGAAQQTTTSARYAPPSQPIQPGQSGQGRLGGRWGQTDAPAYGLRSGPPSTPLAPIGLTDEDHLDDLPTAQMLMSAPAPQRSGARGGVRRPMQGAKEARRTSAPVPAPARAKARRRSPSRTLLATLLVVVLIAGLGYGVYKVFFATPSVQLYVVKNQALTSYVGGGGLTYPAQALNIIYPVNAIVVKVNVQVGQTVSVNQPLIALNSADLTSQLQQALAQYQAAQNYLDSLYATGANAAAIAAAQAQVTAAKGRYDALNAQLNSSTYSNGNIIAPFQGVITAINVVSGTIAPANTPLLTLQDESSVVVHVQLPLEQRTQVQLGQTAEVDPDATPNESFHGIVTVINPALTNVGSDTFEVWITVLNPQLQLLVGESVYARISTEEVLPTVPELAVVNPDSDSIVFVYSHGRAHARPVVVGVRDLDLFGIQSGLKAGDEVILVGQYQLSDNEPVTVSGIQR